MGLDAIGALMNHQIGNGFSIPADDDGFAVLFQLGQQAGKVSLGLVNVYGFHNGIG